MNLLWVFAGGGLGSVARYLMVGGVTRVLGNDFPYGVLLVNVLGSFVIGFLASFMAFKMPEAEQAKLMLVTGFLGGFTTYSAYSMDIVNLMQRGVNAWAAAYALGTLVLCVLACFAGLMASRLVTA